jgi:hypothetical protein
MLYKLQLIHPRLSSCASPQVSAFSHHIDPIVFAPPSFSAVCCDASVFAELVSKGISLIPLSGFLLRTLRTRGIWIEAGFFVLCSCVVCSRLGVLVGICVDFLTILLGVLWGLLEPPLLVRLRRVSVLGKGRGCTM